MKHKSNPVAVGCAVIFAVLFLLGGCAALVGLADANNSTATKPPSPTPTRTPTPTTTATAPRVDKPAQSMCKYAALATAHRKVGNEYEAITAEFDAQEAARKSKVPAVKKLHSWLPDEHMARIRSWCKTNLPAIKPPKVKRSPDQDVDVPDADVPDTGSDSGGGNDRGGWGGGGRRGRWGF